MRTYAQIDIDAIKYNIRQVKSLTDSKIMAIIKADAYGHGAVEVGKALLEEGVYAFGVATADEAMELRNHGFTIPILILGVIFPEDYHKMIENNISMSVASFEDAFLISNSAKELGKNAHIHIRICLLCPPDHRLQRFPTPLQGQLPVRHRTVAVGREIKPKGRRPEQAHFLRNIHKDFAVLAAAEAVNSDDAPPDSAVLRLIQYTGNLKSVVFEGESSFHISLPKPVGFYLILQ